MGKFKVGDFVTVSSNKITIYEIVEIAGDLRAKAIFIDHHNTDIGDQTYPLSDYPEPHYIWTINHEFSTKKLIKEWMTNG